MRVSRLSQRRDSSTSSNGQSSQTSRDWRSARKQSCPTPSPQNLRAVLFM